MSWPLKTAGMPIVPLWTNLIIIFEMTMLSAIIATVITLLITAGLPSRGGKLYDPEVSDGYILVGVENPSDAPRLESALAHRRRPRQDDLVHGLHGLHGLFRRRTHGQPRLQTTVRDRLRRARGATIEGEKTSDRVSRRSLVFSPSLVASRPQAVRGPWSRIRAIREICG